MSERKWLFWPVMIHYSPEPRVSSYKTNWLTNTACCSHGSKQTTRSTEIVLDATDINRSLSEKLHEQSHAETDESWSCIWKTETAQPRRISRRMPHELVYNLLTIGLVWNDKVWLALMFLQGPQPGNPVSTQPGRKARQRPLNNILNLNF